LVEHLCDTFYGGCLVCDESFTNEGLMDIEKNILQHHEGCFEVVNSIALLDNPYALAQLGLFVRLLVAPFMKRHHKIVMIHFVKPIHERVVLRTSG